MKIHTTKKAIRNSGNIVISVPYCMAQTLLRFNDPFAYNSGVYGWNCDYYRIDGVIICTGYRPHGYANSGTYETIAHYEKLALDIAGDWSLTYEQRRDYTKTLLDKCIDTILHGGTI